MAPSCKTLNDAFIGKLLLTSGTEFIPPQHCMDIKQRPDEATKPRWADRVVWNEAAAVLLVRTTCTGPKWPAVMLFYPGFTAEDWARIVEDPGHLAWVKSRSGWAKKSRAQCSHLRREAAAQQKEKVPAAQAASCPGPWVRCAAPTFKSLNCYFSMPICT